MTNIDRIRKMSAEELAEYLDDHGAEVPADFCNTCEYYGTTDCGNCRYLDGTKAWKAWLEREEGGSRQ